MKKRFFFGVALIGLAFTGAAFTANKANQSNHYVQLPSSCEPIGLTGCVPNRTIQCQEFNAGALRDVYQSEGDGTTCSTRLYDPNN